MSDREWKTLADIVADRAARLTNHVAFAFEGRETTFGEFDRRTNQVARALLSLDVARGDRVCYLGKNSDYYFELFLGAAKLGTVTTPIGWRLAAAEVSYIVNDSKATASLWARSSRR